jgi:ankyrin repeat protein
MIAKVWNRLFTHLTTVIFFSALAACGGRAAQAKKPRTTMPDSTSNAVSIQTLMNAIHDNDIVIVSKLLEDKKSVPISTRDAQGFTPLALAAYLGRVEIAAALLANGADVDAGLQNRTSPLMLASMGNHLKVVSFLIDAGADVNRQTDAGVSALMLATIQDHQNIVSLLLKRGADPNLPDQLGDTALVGAAAAAKLGPLQALLTMIDRLELKARAITQACLAGHIDVFDMLADSGVDVDARSSQGWTCLMLAVWKGHLNLARAALKRGANPDAADPRGWSALMSAAAAGDADMVELLLEKGADPNHKDAEGRTAVTVAESLRDRSVAEPLWKAVGSVSPRTLEKKRSTDLTKPLQCPEQAAFSSAKGEMASLMSPVLWHPADMMEQWGRGFKKFSEVETSKQVPAEVCRPDGEVEYLFELVCEDGSKPFTTPEQVQAARVGSVGRGGRCGKIIDLFIIHCEEASYKVYLDMYHCSLFD